MLLTPCVASRFRQQSAPSSSGVRREFERQMGVVEEIAKRRRNVLRELAK